MKFLRFKDIQDVTPPDLDGHKYRLKFQIGEQEGENFRSEGEYELDVEVSRTLQTVWNKSDAEVAASSATLATFYVLALASEGRQNELAPLKLNTYTAPKKPPSEPIVVPGSMFPVHRPPETRTMAMGISFLSDDISKIRDRINALTTNMWNGRLLLLSQERALFDMYKAAPSEEEFKNRVQSLARIATDLDVELLEVVTKTKRSDNVGPLNLLEKALADLSDAEKAKEICDVLKNINYIRQGYPAHSDNAKKYLPAHTFFDLDYPIADYEAAWEKILGTFFSAMRELLGILSAAWKNSR